MMSTFQKLKFNLSSTCRIELQSIYTNKPLKPLDWVTVSLVMNGACHYLDKSVLECEIEDYAIVLGHLHKGELQSDESHLFAVHSDVDQYNTLQSDDSLQLSYPESGADHDYRWYGRFRLIYGRTRSVWVFNQGHGYFMKVTKNFDFDPWLDNMPAPSQYEKLANQTTESPKIELDGTTIGSTADDLQKLHKMTCEYHQWKSDFDLENYL